jgi:predicted ATPase
MAIFRGTCRPKQLLAGAVLMALDLREQGAVDPGAALARNVKGRQMLLVFDNCEHLTRPVVQLTRELLKAGPDLRILATSREPLGLVEEHVVPVPPLELPDPRGTDLAKLALNEAVQLFAERAGAASGHFEVTPVAGSRWWSSAAGWTEFRGPSSWQP